MFSSIRKITRAWLGAGFDLAAFVGLGAGAVEAAPQALALVATTGEVVFKCEGESCGSPA